jgi:hypothetical protein
MHEETRVAASGSDVCGLALKAPEASAIDSFQVAIILYSLDNTYQSTTIYLAQYYNHGFLRYIVGAGNGTIACISS